WEKWHPARRVKGLVSERAPGTERPVDDRHMNERPVNETPLAPDGTEWADDHGRDDRLREDDRVRDADPVREEETFKFAPQPQRREARRSQDVALRWDQAPAEDKTEHIFADEWRMLAERPAQERGRAAVPARVARTVAEDVDFNVTDRDDMDYRP